jgi:hypothetical protein
VLPDPPAAADTLRPQATAEGDPAGADLVQAGFGEQPRNAANPSRGQGYSLPVRTSLADALAIRFGSVGEPANADWFAGDPLASGRR